MKAAFGRLFAFLGLGFSGQTLVGSVVRDDANHTITVDFA